MRIEKINKENVKELLPIELRGLKIRFTEIYDNHFSDPQVKTAVFLDRYTFFNKYMILRTEMERREMEYLEDSNLDKVKEVNIKTFLKSLYGIDVPSLPEMVIVKSYVAVSGAYIRTPKEVKQVEVVVRNVEENKDEALEKKITMIVKAKTGKEPNFVYSPAGPSSTYMPLFDLVLRARDEIKIVKIEKTTKKLKKKIIDVKKPEETENIIRIPVGPECKVTATITIDKGQGISALYCGKIKKIRTYLFDKRVKAWTMASARVWIKEHSTKTEKALGEGRGVGGPRQGVGGAEICVCPKCGYEVDHERGEPCAKIKCPECGTPMIGKAQKMAKKLSEAQQKDYDEESALIRVNAKKAKYPHKFEAAKWTHPNGHPRCIHCGDEELVDDKGKSLPCEKPVAKFTIIKVDKKQQIVGGVVYEPGEIDTQGDYTDAKEIEKAMYRFMEKYATDTKRIRINHAGKKLFFPIIESFIPDQDITKGGQKLKAGTWWLMVKVIDKAIWADIEAGKLTGWSMGGRAKG